MVENGWRRDEVGTKKLGQLRPKITVGTIQNEKIQQSTG